MRYDFIAEFFREKEDVTPIYKTHLWGTENAESFIKEIGMTEDKDSTPGYIDYTKEMHQCELTEHFSLEENPELASIIFEGKECRKIKIK